MKKFFSSYYAICFESIIIMAAIYWYFFDNGGTEAIIVGISALGTLIGSVFTRLTSSDKQSATANPAINKEAGKEVKTKVKSKMKIVNKAKIDQQINIDENHGNISL